MNTRIYPGSKISIAYLGSHQFTSKQQTSKFILLPVLRSVSNPSKNSRYDMGVVMKGTWQWSTNSAVDQEPHHDCWMNSLEQQDLRRLESPCEAGTKLKKRLFAFNLSVIIRPRKDGHPRGIICRQNL